MKKKLAVGALIVATAAIVTGGVKCLMEFVDDDGLLNLNSH